MAPSAAAFPTAWAMLVLCLAGLLAWPPCLPASAAGAADLPVAWRQIGYGGGGRFTAIAIDPHQPSTLYVGSDVAGFFRSRDGGASFVPLGHDLGGFAMADILADPHTNRLFLLTDDGLYVSTDGGDHQHRISATIRYNKRDPGSHLLLTAPHDAVLAGTEHDGVFLVVPNGTTWTVTGLGLAGQTINGLARHDDTLYVATNRGVWSLGAGQGSFTPCNQGLSDSRTVTDIAAQAGTLYCMEHTQGVFALKDGVWTPRGPHPASLPASAAPQYKTLAVDPSHPQTLLAATHPRFWPYLLLRSTDAGAQWQSVTRFVLGDGPSNWATGLAAPERIAFSPDGRLAVLTDWWNVWRSFDGGASWRQSHKGLQNTVVNDIRSQPDKPGRLYLAVADSGLMLSDNDGKSWKRAMAGVVDGHGQAVALAPGRPDTLYLLVTPWEATDQGDMVHFHLYRSDDGARTWRHYRFAVRRKTMTVPYADGLANAVWVSPRDPGRVLVAVSGYGIYALDTNAAPTAGDTPVQDLSRGITTPYFKGSDCLVADPRQPDTLYVATQEGGVFKTTDGGQQWRQLPGTEGFVFALAMDPADPRHLIAAAAEKTLLVSRDAGATWKQVRLPGNRPPFVPAMAVAFGPAGSGLVFAGTSAYDNKAADGLFISRDGGKHFEHAAMDLPRVAINCLRTRPGHPKEVLVGFNGLGFYAANMLSPTIGPKTPK